VAWALSIVGKVMFQQDDFVTAGAYFREGLTISREIGFKWGIALSLEGIARVAAVQRRAELALQLAGGADALRQAIGVPLSAVEFAEFEHALAPAYDSLSEQTASNAWDEGRKPDLEELIRRALENVVPISNPR
jgi:hypothetical protein